MTQHALSANLVRYNYYNVDRGTFKKDVVPTLSDGLIIEIKNYIRLSGRTYYYTLFDEFKYELEILGINNRYMLKSVIDPQLEDEFICNRDFVDKSNHSKTDKSQINSYSKINKIINLNTKKDINSNLSKDISESPIKVVNNYNKITIEKIKKRFIENGKKYKLDYVVETIAELTTFNFKDFDRYAKIYGINSFISYLEFQVYMSNSFMQIDMDKCTNKSNLKLYKNVLKEFKDKIDYFIDKYGFIDTRTFNEYNEIPGLKQECNKYILVGIIRSYLNRHFTIEYTDSLYNMTDYIIYNNSNISIEVAETPVIIQNDYNKIIKENVKERFIVNDKKYKFNCIVETTNKLSAFNYKVFERYAKKYGIRDFISYLEFQVLMSDTFMQIDKDECISKNSLNLDRYQLNILKDNIDNFLDKYELIDTRTFNEYEELPGFKGKCNKYILVGIIRSYLSRYYKIEYTDSAYDKTDYIIKN